MDTIVATALIGTGQQSAPDITTGTSLDALTAQLASEGIERRLLLMAGALALYRRAGKTSMSAPTLPELAQPETLRTCSAKVAQILADLFQSGQRDQFLEAYALLKKAHMHLPFELLPMALDYATRDQILRMPLVPLLGERGYWLCQFNPSWSWVDPLRLEMQQILPADFETLWQEGTLGQRAKVLQQLRTTEPSRALEWLESVWKKEKVDVRAAFLQTLRVGLSLADQPFLARALNDRGESVRYIAANLLTCLTDSPQALRLRARADDLLQYENGKLIVTLPASIDSAWIQDVSMLKGSEQKNISQTDGLKQALSRVPPVHWEERFSASPTQLLAALVDSEWTLEVVNALTNAAILYTNTHWFLPLTDWYAQRMESGRTNDREVFSYYRLLSHLSQQEVENRVRRQLARQDQSLQAIQRLTAPWSVEFSRDFLQSMKARYHELRENQSPTNQWASVLDIAAAALAPACFDEALTGWNFFEHDSNYVSYWNTRLHSFLQKIKIRKSLIEEIR